MEFASFLGARHTIAVNSGTAALHLALDAVGIQQGDEVLVPTMTFAATAEVVLYFKARPVLVDCQQDTLNLEPDQVERAITARTKAILPVHFGGHPCEMDRILEIARDHGLNVIEDAAHAIPACHQGKKVGTIPAASASILPKYLRIPSGGLPPCQRRFQRIVFFPIYPRMTDADVQDVIEAVREIVGQYRR